MTAKPRTEPRSLIVVSTDWREFDLAMYFLRGQSLANGAAVALPHDRALFPAWRSLPVTGFPYATVDDLLAIVDDHKPDVVFLFSGYLFVEYGPLLPESLSLQTLLEGLRTRGCRVVTSDPLLGLTSRLTHSQLDPRMLGPALPAFNRWLLRVGFNLKSSRAKIIRIPRLGGVTHLYSTSIPDLEDGTQSISFFNPSIIGAASGAAVVQDARELAGASAAGGRPRWVFILSQTDVKVQERLLGLPELMERLLGMLRHALANERHPTLVAPAPIVAQLGNSVPGAEVLSFCPFPELQRRLVDAEYAFFWNAFSIPQLIRIANELPIFLFDRGHLARAIEPYYERAKLYHFGGWEPPYLDPRQIFSPYVLSHLSKAQKPAMRALREHWQRSPSPDELIVQLAASGRVTSSG